MPAEQPLIDNVFPLSIERKGAGTQRLQISSPQSSCLTKAGWPPGAIAERTSRSRNTCTVSCRCGGGSSDVSPSTTTHCDTTALPTTGGHGVVGASRQDKSRQCPSVPGYYGAVLYSNSGSAVQRLLQYSRIGTMYIGCDATLHAARNPPATADAPGR